MLIYFGENLTKDEERSRGMFWVNKLLNKLSLPLEFARGPPDVPPRL